jgi:4-amino-4-deoxy-L-arabinose transferase-like glycosyltransferase
MLDKSLAWINKHLVILLLAVAGLRLAFLALNGLDLLGDESYYWDWSRQPDWCYYSKPPMVAWLIGAFTWLLGDYTFTVRLPTVILGTVFLGYFYATAKAFYGQRAAAFALLMILATPINMLANFLMTIDPPLYCFWMMSLYYLRKALFDGCSRAWFWAGLASGAALLSKQVAIALPLLVLVFLIIEPSRLRLLKREFFWYLLPILLAALPILLWNQQHDWVMFGHSKGHFEHKDALSFAQHLKDSLDFLLYQVLLVSPILFAVVVIVSVHAAIKFKTLTSQQRFLWLTGPLLLLVILVLSLLQKVQGNWPMPFYFSGLILLAGYWQAGAWQKTLKFGLGLGYLMVVMTCILPLLLQLFNLQNTAFDPTKRFKNWQQVAVNIHQQRLIAQPDLHDTFVVALGHRYLASQLGFYLADHPPVYRFDTSGQVLTQYEVWEGPLKFVGKNAFVISESADQVPADLKSAFASFRLVAEIANPNKANASYFLYLAENLQAWPKSAQPVQSDN